MLRRYSAGKGVRRTAELAPRRAGQSPRPAEQADNGADEDAAWFEADTVLPRRPLYSVSSDDPNPLYGRVAYTHAATLTRLDQLLSLVRMGYADRSPSRSSASRLPRALRVAHLGYIVQRREVFMSKTATVRARVEPALKEKAEKVLGELGLNATIAITLYYEQIVRRHAIPFEISLPNVATLSAMRDAEAGVGLTRAKDAVALLAALDSDD